MADGAAAALAAMADDGRALVDAETLRGLRGAERPAMPDASQPAPTLVGHTSDRVNPEISAAVPEGMTLELFQDAALRQDDAITLPNRVSDDAAAADATPVGFVAAPDSAPAGSSAAVAAAPRGSSRPPAAVEQAVVPAAPVAAAEATAAADAAAITAPPAPDPAPPQPVAPALVPVADPARLDARNASTLEDQPVPLDIAASLADLDGAGGETLAIVIAGLPPGSVLSAGTQQADGSWVLTPDQLAGLLLTPPRDWSGDAVLSIRAIVTGQTGDQVETATTLNLHVEAVADAPAVAASGGGAEDTAIPLSLDVRATDIDGSESITSVRISGVPDGASLSAGTRGADGVWTLDPADLAGVTLTPPLHFSGSIGLALTAVSTEPNASTAASAIAFTVGVTAVADAPLATAQDSSGNEDSWIPLNGLSAALVDRDGSEALTVAIAGVPDGAALSAGARQPDGSWQVPVSALA
ncbi:MAG: hypothetical protein IT556_00150, partial [Acetobacteraceae bacterium]|nr:hypothetical protein [Acetobacteraceae bacterium]